MTYISKALHGSVMCIDPGTTHSGICFLSQEKEILAHGKVENASVVELIKSSRAFVLAMETVTLHTKAGKTTAKTIFCTGVFHSTFNEATPFGRIHHHTRQQVLNYLLGKKYKKIAGNDSMIRSKLIEIYGDKCKGVTRDAWSALAVGYASLSGCPECYDYK